MKRSVGTVALLVALALSTAGWAQDEWKAPAKAAGTKNPLQGKPQLAAGGEKLYNAQCASCHMDVRKGERGMGPSLAAEDVVKQTDGELFWKITNGNAESGMPAFSTMPANQRWQIILFLREVQKQKKQ